MNMVPTKDEQSDELVGKDLLLIDPREWGNVKELNAALKQVMWDVQDRLNAIGRQEELQRLVGELGKTAEQRKAEREAAKKPRHSPPTTKTEAGTLAAGVFARVCERMEDLLAKEGNDNTSAAAKLGYVMTQLTGAMERLAKDAPVPSASE